jgi:hypothetical protein
VYAISPKRVIKVALNKAGLAQNRTEVDVATDPKTRPVIANVFQADDDYKWIVSELVRPISVGEFKSLTGIDHGTFRNFINYSQAQEEIAASQKSVQKGKETKPEPGRRSDAKSSSTTLGSTQMSPTLLSKTERDKTAKLENITKIKQTFDVDVDELPDPERDSDTLGVSRRQRMSNIMQKLEPKQRDFLLSVAALVNTADLLTGDVAKINSWGKTADGRLVLFDYGYTPDVKAKHYHPMGFALENRRR